MHRILLTIGTVLLTAQVGRCQTGGPGLYSRRYERIDVDAILSSPRLVTNYVECLLNRKPCPPEGKELKRILPEALRTKCSRCWPSQKEGALKVITKLYNDYPKQYSALRQRWDPTGEYHRRFEEYLRDQQFNVIRGSGNDINRDQSGISSRFGAPERTNVVRSTEQATSTTQAPPVRSTPVVRSVTTVQTTPTVQATPTVPATTSRVMDSIFTQRPTRQNNNGFPVQRDEQPSAIVTRFDDSPSEAGDSTTQRPTPSSSAQTAPKATTATQMASPNIGIGYMDPTYMVTVNTFSTRNPILNLINRLSLKFSNTAEFLAGMIRSTVKRI